MLVSLIFIIGVLLGSFYNVIILRVPQGKDFVRSRSQCGMCGTVLRARDLIPVISYLTTRGKCRYCKAKYSAQYPIIELITGALAVVAFTTWGLSLHALFMFVFWSFLLIIGVMDYREGYMYDVFWWIMIPLAIVYRLTAGQTVLTPVLGGISGLLFYGTIYFVARLAYGKEALGQGDVLMMATIGFFIGWQQTIFVGFFAFYVAATWLIIQFIKSKLKREKFSGRLSFGPAIAVATFINTIFVDDIYQWVLSIITR